MTEYSQLYGVVLKTNTIREQKPVPLVEVIVYAPNEEEAKRKATNDYIQFGEYTGIDPIHIRPNEVPQPTATPLEVKTLIDIVIVDGTVVSRHEPPKKTVQQMTSAEFRADAQKRGVWDK